MRSLLKYVKHMYTYIYIYIYIDIVKVRESWIKAAFEDT